MRDRFWLTIRRAIVVAGIAAAATACTQSDLQTVCKQFPESGETGLQNDVEHDSQGNVETGAVKTAGQVAEVVMDPLCGALNQAGVVHFTPSKN